MLPKEHVHLGLAGSEGQMLWKAMARFPSCMGVFLWVVFNVVISTLLKYGRLFCGWSVVKVKSSQG